MSFRREASRPRLYFLDASDSSLKVDTNRLRPSNTLGRLASLRNDMAIVRSLSETFLYALVLD